ncbi:MAG: hypothetical protein B7Y41_07020 [Hydrogenophilales bacterium 28-61-23]|nr:MAG: hypothetical protein B7Y41_07020 [Hydrogenophilales bacterium 28-61-23]
MACPAGELCIDDGNLISVFPDELSEKQKKAGGMELARSLEQTTHKLGADFQIVFSGRNYTNFHFDKSSRQYVYEVVTIDGIPIEKSGFKKIWLIQFNEEPNINPRSSDLRMAATKIIELEFIDEDMPHH